MTDFEILSQYMKEKDISIDEKLSPREYLLCRQYLRDTLSFNLYLLKYRVREFLKTIIEIK